MTFRDLVIRKFGSIYAAAKHFDELDGSIISGTYIYKLCSGEYSNVSIKMLPILCRELEVDVLDLLESFGIDTGVI